MVNSHTERSINLISLSKQTL